MAEAFQVVGAAIAIAELSLKAYHTLSTFISAAKVTNQTTSDLFATVQRFKCTLSSVKSTINVRTQQLKAGAVVSKEEADIYANLEDTLRGWQSIVDRFMARLRSLKRAINGIQYPSWTDQLLAQLEFDRKQPIIVRFEASMNGHMTVTSLLLNCLKIYMQQADTEYIDRKLRKIERLQQQTNEILAKNQTWDDDTRMIAQPMKKWRGAIATTKSVSDKFSNWAPDARSLADRDRDASDFSFPLRKADSATGIGDGDDVAFDSEDEDKPDEEEDLRDPKPDFDDSWPKDLLDALITAHLEEIDADEKCGHLEEAESNQRRLIEYYEQRLRTYAEPYDKDEQIRRLARLLRMRRKFSDSSQILTGRLNEQDMAAMAEPQLDAAAEAKKQEAAASLDVKTQERDSDFWYDLAETKHDQWQAEESDTRQSRDYRISILKNLSEVFAKRAFKLRLTIRDSSPAKFAESVELLQAIWESQGAVVPASAIRKLYPTSSNVDEPPLSPEANPSRKLLLNAIATGNGDEINRLVKDGQGQSYLSDVFMQLGLPFNNSSNTLEKNSSSPTHPALFAAIARGDFKAVRLLLEHGADVNQKDADSGQTPIMLAAQRRDGVTLAMLCHRRPNLEARDHEGRTALHHALHGQGGSEAVWTLLQYGANALNHCCELGTPLHDAIIWGREPYAQLMLDNASSAIIEAGDKDGQTPLYLAITRHRFGITKMLLRRGAVLDRNTLPDRGNVNLDFRRLLDSVEAERMEEAAARRRESELPVFPPELKPVTTSHSLAQTSEAAKKKPNRPENLLEFAQRKQKKDEKKGLVKRRNTDTTDGSGSSPTSPRQNSGGEQSSIGSFSGAVSGRLSRIKTSGSITNPLRGWGLGNNSSNNSGGG